MAQLQLKPSHKVVQEYHGSLAKMLGQVITVSLETLKIIASLPQLSFQ